MICGLEKPTSGRILFGDDDVTSFLPEHRGVGMVFQNYALYPHLTVKQNILFPLQNLKERTSFPDSRWMSGLRNTSPSGTGSQAYVDRRPSELSGGSAAARSHCLVHL